MQFQFANCTFSGGLSYGSTSHSLSSMFWRKVGIAHRHVDLFVPGKYFASMQPMKGAEPKYDENHGMKISNSSASGAFEAS
jgi:hypothetical protein